MQGITLFRKFVVLVDGKEAETDTGEEPQAEPAPLAGTSASKSESPAAPLTEQEMEVLEDRRRAFKKARAAWVAVKTKAELDLEKVKDGARMMYLADAKQFPKVVQGCKDIDAILDNLDDELRDTLDQRLHPAQEPGQAAGACGHGRWILDKYHRYVAGNEVMKAIDLKEFADVTIHAPVMKALNDLRRALS
jgi:hypothetical protein